MTGLEYEREQQLRSDLKGLLEDLAKSEEELRDAPDRERYYHRLEKLYQDGERGPFRHFYSDIFSTLTRIAPGEEELDRLTILAQNLEVLRQEYPSYREGHGEREDIVLSLRKLYDHVNLDVARITYTYGLLHGRADAPINDLVAEVNWVKEDVRRAREQVQTAQGELAQSQQQLVETRTAMEAAQGDLNQAKKKIDNAQKEYIAILGIFSAVVLTFIGGIAFTTSVLENLHLASTYRIVLTLCLIGLVLCNVFFLLFFCIQNLLERPIRQPQVVALTAVNAVFIALMAVAAIAWAQGWIEQRDARIETLPPPAAVGPALPGAEPAATPKP